MAPGVHQARANRTGWCLITSGDAVVVVDAGWPKDYDLVVRSLSRIGHSPSAVAGILLTHGHVDHIGCAEEMRLKHDIDSHTRQRHSKERSPSISPVRQSRCTRRATPRGAAAFTCRIEVSS